LGKKKKIRTKIDSKKEAVENLGRIICGWKNLSYAHACVSSDEIEFSHVGTEFRNDLITLHPPIII